MANDLSGQGVRRPPLRDLQPPPRSFHRHIPRVVLPLHRQLSSHDQVLGLEVLDRDGEALRRRLPVLRLGLLLVDQRIRRIPRGRVPPTIRVRRQVRGVARRRHIARSRRPISLSVPRRLGQVPSVTGCHTTRDPNGNRPVVVPNVKVTLAESPLREIR